MEPPKLVLVCTETGSIAVVSHLAKRYGLLVTGGSDYHGTGKVNRLGENLTDLSQWEKIKERAGSLK